jgi:hypothetical protein
MEKNEIRQLLNSFVVKAPCSQDWNDMVGDDKVRLCSQCNLNVHNVSAMTDVEAAVVLKRRQAERVCVYAYQRPDGSVITDNCPTQLRKYRKKLRTTIAAAVVTVCYAAVLSAQASRGLVGAAVDPAFSQTQEVGMLVDYGYDTARDIARALTFIASAIVFFWPLDKTKKHSVKKLILETLALACVPIGVQTAGLYAINNFGGLGGGI